MERFRACQERLEAELEALSEQAGREVRALTAAAGQEPGGTEPDPRLGPLGSLLKHRPGLTVFATLDRAGIDLRRWLEAFLRECAALGPRAVVADPRAWLP